MRLRVNCITNTDFPSFQRWEPSSSSQIVHQWTSERIQTMSKTQNHTTKLNWQDQLIPELLSATNDAWWATISNFSTESRWTFVLGTGNVLFSLMVLPCVHSHAAVAVQMLRLMKVLVTFLSGGPQSLIGSSDGPNSPHNIEVGVVSADTCNWLLKLFADTG